jgi:hypothetical protein
VCSLGGCERSLGFLVPGEHLQAAVRRLHRRLIEYPEVVPGGLSLSSRSAAMRVARAFSTIIDRVDEASREDIFDGVE